jgi:hypothetical protein
VRAFAACWAVAFAAFTLGLPLLDAQQEHAEVVVHWEDAGATSCPAAHSPECIACHAVSGSRAVAPERSSFAFAGTLSDAAIPEGRSGVFALAARSLPSTRAPPSA